MKICGLALLILLNTMNCEELVATDEDPLLDMPGRLLKRGVTLEKIEANGDDFMEFMGNFDIRGCKGF